MKLYNVHNKKASKILVFKVIWYHHEFACTLNSAVFKLCFCLLFLKSIMMTLWVRSFGLIWIRISDSRSLGSWCIKGTNESMTRVDSLVLSKWSWITDPDLDNPRVPTLYLEVKLLIRIGLKIITIQTDTKQRNFNHLTEIHLSNDPAPAFGSCWPIEPVWL